MKKFKPYLYTILTVLGILAIIFIVKGIFPFGKHSLIWGDMHDQVTAFYYHLYDSVYNNGSLFYDFRIGGGIAFIGLIAYYILSPLSLLVLLVPRDYIYLMVSVIIAFKILLCSITCLYFIKTYFKKIPAMLAVLLAILYAFSGYGLVMYQITPWIDTMYMFPLIMIGLKKVLDLEKPTFYIVTLTLSLIFSFYTAFMSILFIFLASIIYLHNYVEKENYKKVISSLGLSTVLSILISSFIVIPAYLQINESSRIGFKLSTLLNSKLGPITDKVGMLLFGGLIYVAILLLLKDYKKHKDFLKFYIPTLLLVTVPFIIEPINKVWHFGSYAFFPCRFGFITVFIFILGAAYYFNNYTELKGKDIKYKKSLSIFITIFISSTICFLAYKFSGQFQTAIHKLSLSYNSKLAIILILMLGLLMAGIYLVLKLNRKLNRFTIVTIIVISLVHVLCSTYLYLGMHKFNPKLTSEYLELLELNKSHNKDDIYRVKSIIDPDDTITNNGLISNYSNIDEFSSLTNKNNLETFKKLGYGTQWVLTYSRGSTLFMDSILGNKYIISHNDNEINNYTLSNKYRNISLYTNNNLVSFGFLINKNDTIFDKNNSFEIANSLYKNVLETDDNIFKIDSDFDTTNINGTLSKNNLTKYTIIDKEKEAYFSKKVEVVGKQNLYLEITHTLSNYDNENLNEKFDLYVNNELVCEDCFTEPHNGSYDLGAFSNEIVDIKLVLKGTTLIKNIYLGQMDIEKYNDFLNKYYVNTNLKYNRNSISVKVDTDNEKILFLPLNYSKDFKAYNNDKEVEVLKLYDNFIGIKLDKGLNDITIKYIPNDFIKFSLISLFFLVITIILLKTNLYNKIISNNIVGTISYNLYKYVNIFLIITIYIGLTLIFLLSFIKYIRI